MKPLALSVALLVLALLAGSAASAHPGTGSPAIRTVHLKGGGYQDVVTYPSGATIKMPAGGLPLKTPAK